MLMPKPDRCMYSHCWNEATHKHQNLNCFAFCDDHWPGFLEVLTRGLKPVRASFKAEGVRLMRDGMAPSMVARRLGVKEATVYEWRKDTDIPHIKPAPVSEDEIAEGLRLRELGLSWRQVAEQLGRHQKTVEKIMSPRAGRMGRYESFFDRVRESGVALEFPGEYSDSRYVVANVNKGQYIGAPKGTFRARTVNGVVWVEAVQS